MAKRFFTVGLSILMVLVLVMAGGCDDFTDIIEFLQEQSDAGEQDDAIAADDDGIDDSSAALETGQPAKIIPFDDLMGFSEYANIQVSSDGSEIMYRHMSDYGDDVIVEQWRTGKKTTVVWPNVYGIPRYYFAPDGETVLFFVDDRGDENTGIYTSDIDTGKTRTIFEAGSNDCMYIANNPSDVQEIYIMKFNFDTSLFDLYLLNYITGENNLVLRNNGDIITFVFDNDGVLWGVGTTDDEAGLHYWLKKDVDNDNKEFKESEWELVFSWDYEDAKTSGLRGFMPDNERILYIDTADSNTSTVYTYDVKTGQSSKVYNHPDYDVDGMWIDLELEEVVAVSVYGQKVEWDILDESFRSDYDVLAGIGDGVFNFVDSSEKDEVWLVQYVSDVKDADYYLYDMATQEATFLFNARASLDEYEFAPVEPIEYTATDGLQIEGYATFPVGVGRENLPTVVMVHGGPWSRDVWDFNPETQFLANRGYLVLQVNFRGSTGYGKDFILAGDKEWGGKMHQDILDAVAYAIEMGWTDPDRVGVYGASYGGYEALVCAAFSSDVFKCAVDAFGPSSLLTFVESIPPQWSTSYPDLIRSVGDPETEAEFMAERSPLYFAEDIKIPLLIVQGDNDIRVVQSESDQMVAALEAAGIPVEYIVFKDTGHGFSSIETRNEFYTRMEAFFAEHLGGRVE
ncbi:MAG: S9 family peptidase [Clostridia bacterium]|jgi:dipeptidyl aminopeptidase/acylaminoacyl peptidase|nr:S9 family peptidase [Clostridia bacterium]MBT7121848.1 S9 family peptidase [Clostridia bacterium]